MGVLEAARRSHAQLPMPKHSGKRDVDRDLCPAAILERQRVHGARHVGIAAIRRKDCPPQHEITNRARERRNPAEGAFPGNRNIGELVAYSGDDQAWPSKRRPHAVDEVGMSREFDRRTRRTMQHADRANRRVSRMNAWQGNPMVARDLPGDGWRGKRRHRRMYILGGKRGMITWAATSHTARGKSSIVGSIQYPGECSSARDATRLPRAISRPRANLDELAHRRGRSPAWRICRHAAEQLDALRCVDRRHAESSQPWLQLQHGLARDCAGASVWGDRKFNSRRERRIELSALRRPTVERCQLAHRHFATHRRGRADVAHHTRCGDPARRDADDPRVSVESAQRARQRRSQPVSTRSELSRDKRAAPAIHEC